MKSDSRLNDLHKKVYSMIMSETEAYEGTINFNYTKPISQHLYALNQLRVIMVEIESSLTVSSEKSKTCHCCKNRFGENLLYCYADKLRCLACHMQVIIQESKKWNT